MSKLPKELGMTFHAQQRLSERVKLDNKKYNRKNLMKSACKWYTKDDVIFNSSLYWHISYVCRKSNQLNYITDGEIEIIYNQVTNHVVTILEMKEKFKPIIQYIKPEILSQIERKKELRKMNKSLKELEICPDCGEENYLVCQQDGNKRCKTCATRYSRAKYNKAVYTPYKNLSEIEKQKVDRLRKSHLELEAKKREERSETIVQQTEITTVDNYYQAKAEKAPAVITKDVVKSKNKITDDEDLFIQTLVENDCGSEETLKDILNVLMTTDKLKDILMTITSDTNQQAMLDLEQSLSVIEKRLQRAWEENGFQTEDDKKFKNFITWRKIVKDSIYFWKRLYSTNTLLELQRAWNVYANVSDFGENKEERMSSIMKRWQITTETISTIYNTRRPFTRVFYAATKEDAYNTFVKWLSDRQLHENKEKTIITELTNVGERINEEESETK